MVTPQWPIVLQSPYVPSDFLKERIFYPRILCEMFKVESSGCYLEFRIGGGFLASRWGIEIHHFSEFLGFSAAPLHLTDVSSLLGGLPLSLLKPVCILCWSVLPRPLFFSPLASFPSYSFKFSFAHLTFPGSFPSPSL